MHPDLTVIISVFDHVQEAVARHAVTFDGDLMEQDAEIHFKEHDSFWRPMLYEGCTDPIVDIEFICSHTDYRPE